MKTNVGSIDRVLRVLLGLGLLVAGLVTQSWWGLIGIIPLGTAAIGWCPVYLPFGLSTCRRPKSDT